MMDVVKYVLISYLSILLVVFFAQRSLLYYPPGDPGPPAVHGLADAQVIEVSTADGLRLRSWFIPPRDMGKPVIVQFHGNASWLAGRTDFSRNLADLGYGILITSYRGYSGNPGAPSEQGLYADARASLDWLNKQGLGFVLVGESLGTGVAVQMATEYPARGVVLEAPYTSIAATAQHHYWYFPAYWLVRDRFDSLSKIDRIKAPLFIVHGAEDNVVPTKFGRQLYEKAMEPKQAHWVSGSGHNDYYGGFAGPAWQALLDFLKGV
jgi:fermentation-respiration switch protein FrsA (DUF1100 family)